MAKRFFVIDAGARGHALLWHLCKYNPKDEFFAAPGNAGMAEIATCLPIAADNVFGLIQAAEKIRPDITVVGPEAPLVAGIADEFEARGLALIGPKKNAAWLEGSKAEARLFMRRQRILIPEFRIYSTSQEREACDYITQQGALSLVIKADGLCQGKGVVLPESQGEGYVVVRDMLSGRRFGEAGKRIVIEERLHGRECSLIVITDGVSVKALLPAHDFKRRFEGDRGPNTGGMGALCPDPILTPKLLDLVMRDIVTPTINGMNQEGCPFTGFLYVGLMLTDDDIYVLEYNVRMGDPEASVILPLLETNSAEIYKAIVSRTLKDVQMKWSDGKAVCRVLVSEGYPGKYETGKRISDLFMAKSLAGVLLFHAGTAENGDLIVTNGGRVIDVVGLGGWRRARTRSLIAANIIKFEGKDFRRDISI